MTSSNEQHVNASHSDKSNDWDREQVRDTLDAVQGLLATYVAGKRSEAKWNLLKRTVIATFVLMVLAVWAIFYFRALGFQSDPIQKSLAMIPIHGTIASGAEASADRLVPLIERACEAAHVEGLILDIDSGGGSPSESERIIAAVEQCKSGGDGVEGKPVYAMIGSVGASAAYMIGMHCDEIFAGRYSIVGSIGAIIRMNDLSQLAGQLGVKERSFKSAPLKGGPSMLSGVTAADEEELNGLVTDLGKTFLADVQQSRGDAIKISGEELFSGRVWTADEALQIGLIDQIAVLEELKHTRFKDKKIHLYRTKPSIAETMGLTQMVHDVIADFAAPKVQ